MKELAEYTKEQQTMNTVSFCYRPHNGKEDKEAEIERENRFLEKLEREMERKQLRLLRENNRILKENIDKPVEDDTATKLEFEKVAIPSDGMLSLYLCINMVVSTFPSCVRTQPKLLEKLGCSAKLATGRQHVKAKFGPKISDHLRC